MSNPYRDRLLTVGRISQRTKARVREGRHHPESGVPFKTTEDDATIVTEHSNDRVDSTIKIQAPLHANIHELRERKARANGQQ